MESLFGLEHQKSQDSSRSAPGAPWQVDLKLTHLDWNPEATLIHFQGQYLTICELDYNILQGEIQNIPKNKAEMEIGEFCLVEDLTSARWFRGRVQNRKEDVFDVFLIDHGNVLSVDIAHISSCSKDLFVLPPKIVCGFISNVLLFPSCSHSVVEDYFSRQIGRNVVCFIQAMFPHKTLLLEAPDINSDLVRHGFGRHVDADTFLFLVGLLTELPLTQNVGLPVEKPRGQEFSFKSSGLQRFIDFLSVCGPRLSCGTRATVRVTSAFSPGLFYCQMVSSEANLRQMSKKLARICEFRSEEQENLGDLCAVKGKDGKWHRGFLQFLPNNSHVRVLFIDYGFFEFVKVENIRRLPAALYSAPVMGIPCSLSSVIDQGAALKSQQLSFLKAGLLGAVLVVEINSFSEDHCLYSVTITGAEDEHVGLPKSSHKRVTEQVCEAEEPSPEGGRLSYESMIGEALGEVLEAEGVQVGSIFEGYVEHVQSPNHFWVTTQKRSREFKEMMTALADYFSQVKLDEDMLLDPEPGAKCCALYEEDMHYYRAVVINTLKHGAEVLFTDFGNIAKVPHMVIKNIPEAFANKAGFGICCSLGNVFPLDDFWPSSTCDLFRRAVANKALLVHVVQVGKHKLVVDLFQKGSEKSISELFSVSALAQYVPSKPVVQNNADATEETGSQQSSLRRNRSVTQEQWEVCEERENVCRKEVRKVQGPPGFRFPTVKPGCEFPVRCSLITSPSDFWCQPLETAPALEKLMNEVQQYYAAQTAPLQPGDPCCVAKCPLDGKWYRGFIVGNQQDPVTVLLVDYGSIIQVRQDKLQGILPEHVSCLERQAFRCTFQTLIQPADLKSSEDWTPEACKMLKDFVLNNTGSLKCKVISRLNVKNKGLCSVVYLCSPQQCATHVLVEQGHAIQAAAATVQQATVTPESFVYSSFDLHPGNEERVYVTHVSSQCEVHCHLDKNTGVIEELEMKISEESNKLMHDSTRAAVQKLCLAKYFDGKWYRGVVLPAPSPLHVGVFFVDYGNTKISEKNKVMFIPRDCVDLLFTPMQAVRCNLSSVPKEELYADVKEWLNNAVLNKLVKVIIRGKKEDGSFDVELYDGEMNINEKVKELVLSLSHKTTTVPAVDGKAEAKKKGQHRGGTKPAHQWKDPLKRQTSAFAGNVFRDKEKRTRARKLHWNENRRVKHPQEKTKSSALVKPHTSSTVKQQKENQDAPSKQTQHREETEISQHCCVLHKNVCPGFRAKCYVSHIDSVCSFFLQLSEDEPAILKIAEDLNSSVFRDSLKTATSLRVNDGVLTEFEEDGGLYRSVVKSKEDDSSFKVEFVDYGNSGVVGKEKIYVLPPEYRSQPRFSIPCSLLDTGADRSEASFPDAVMDRPLMVDFVRQNGIQWHVKVEILDQEAGLGGTPESSVLTEIESSTCSPNAGQKVKPCLPEESSQNEKPVVVSAVVGEDVTPPPGTLPTTLRVNTFKHLKQGLARRKTRKTGSASVKLKSSFTSVFSPLMIHATDVETATILSIQTNGSFYVRLTKTNNLLTVLERYIADNLYKCKTIGKEDIKQGLECLVEVESNTWRRGVVHGLGGETIKVLLVDHGIIKDIPTGSIQQRCGDLTKFPDLAVLCRMKRVGFREQEDPHSSWWETLKPIIGTEVKLLFEHYSETGSLWMVDIIMSGLLLTQQTKAPQQQSETEILSSAGTQSERSGKEATSDRSAPQQLFFAPPDTNKAYSGVAAAVTTPSEFCVVLEDLFLVMNKVSIMLDDLPGRMSPLPEAHLVPGNCCLLKSHSGDKWCRAEIVNADATVVLNLVDYGYCECMPYHDFSKLKELPVELSELPKLTYPCALRGVKPAGEGEQWADEATVFFQQCLLQKDLQIFFKEFVSDSHWQVDVVSGGADVAQELVDAGHADYIDGPFGSQVPPVEDYDRGWTRGRDVSR
ncbi:tudor domain-containing protein 15 [Xenentodon cancila]